MMVNTVVNNSITLNSSKRNSVFTDFLKLKWRSSKEPKINLRQRLPNTVDDIERDWVKHNALRTAFEGDFKAPVGRLLEAGGLEVLDIGTGAGFWTNEMASQFPLSHFTGIDLDKNVLPTSLLSRNVVYQRIDLIELPLPYENDSFDYIFIRSMLDTLPDSMWDSILKELIRIMKKGAYIECVEAYENLFDAGPSMRLLNQLIQQSLQHPPQSPTTPLITNTTNNTNANNCISSSSNYNTEERNPWPNRLANMTQLKNMHIYHTHTPIGIHGHTVGTLLLEFWERTIKSFQREWITNKLITEKDLVSTIKSMRNEVDEYKTYMSWYSVVAQKKGYDGPILRFDDVDEYDRVYTTIIA
ncbi:S-adenosyl-L-methionine-dependent methyltransferase [Mycotypha africana]|uniref:S-adenosyl-L-methionine-dependent methyltransferase n=1 Tax=Mycotypha africana TaxID=64632 RepID=UPI002300D5A4|nr:S-adenosyl-L-methionine-dependent methyltransferase [Mycotypha africana]KAI8984410.1 S-adenosyl-L-methionine-dependent methyltransferase [Mycotypha africana]